VSARKLLIGGLALGLMARCVFAFVDDGLWWPDEYYQSLEPAHRAVFGYGWQAWEFLEGARHWTLPGFVAALMKLSDLGGLPYLRVIELTFCLTGAATGLAVHFLARAIGASERSAAVSATVFSLMGLAVYMGPRPMGEGLSALPVALALTLVLGAPSRAKVILAGVLLSLAVGLRLQNGLFCLGALAMVKERRGLLLLTLSIGALLYGLIDLVTWGSWFHSARVYLQFNLVEGRASSFGTAPFLHYLTAFITAEGLTFLPLLGLSVVSFKQSRALPLMMLAFLLVHSFIPHKELRFLFPIVPLLAAQAALGLDRLAKPWAAPALLGLSVLSLATLPLLTFGRLGIIDPPRATPALDFGGPENRLLVLAGRRRDLCGLQIRSIENWRTGGFAYFHARAPLYRREQGLGHFNYVLARRGSVEGEEIAVDHDVALIKIDVDNCTPDPTYDWHLE